MDIIIAAVIVLSLIVAGAVIIPTVKMATNVAPYLYANTRASEKSGHILGRKTYDEMLAATYLKEVYVTLEDTNYGHVVEHGHAFASTSALLERDLYETYKWLETVMPDAIRGIISAMKKRFEVGQLKELMNSIDHDEKAGDLPYIEDSNVRLKLEEATDRNTLANALEGTPYSDVLKSQTSAATELDRYYLSTVLDAIEGTKDKKAAEAFLKYWRRRIDLANVRMVLRRMKNGDDEPALVDGGYLPVADLKGVTERNQLADVLREGPYDEIDVKEKDMGIEKAFLTSIRKEGSQLSANYPLRGGPIVNFIIKKELEVRNLNIMLKLKEEQFESEEINNLLVV